MYWRKSGFVRSGRTGPGLLDRFQLWSASLLSRSDSLLCNAASKSTDDLYLKTSKEEDFEAINKNQLETIENLELC
jgi:hypothetical protein